MSETLATRFPIAGERVRLELEGELAGRLVRASDGAVVGRFALEANAAAITIRALCVDPDYRSYGLGSEAGRLLREAAEAAGFGLRAWAPPDLGLAVYFWVRMGLRPLHGPGPEGGIWFERSPGVSA
jgi:GNAT superfamily N-acetyltransferase